MKKFLLLFLLIPSLSYAAAPDRPSGSVAISGQVISSTAYNNDLNTLYNYLQAGVDTFVDGSITGADIANSAGIGYSKLTLTGSIVNADIATGSAIEYAKLNLASAIRSSDLFGSIADSKLSTITTAGKVSGTALSVSGQTSGDIIYYSDSTNGWKRVAAVSTGSNYFLRSQGTGNPPVYAQVAKNSDYMFSAYSSAGDNAVTDGDVTFDTEDFDLSNNFSSNTFTAPVTGKYLFTVSISFQNDSGSSADYIEVYLTKNGSNSAIITGGFSNNSTQATGAGGSIILSLAASDTVKVHLLSTSTVATDINGGATKTRFTGCYLP